VSSSALFIYGVCIDKVIQPYGEELCLFTLYTVNYGDSMYDVICRPHDGLSWNETQKTMVDLYKIVLSLRNLACRRTSDMRKLRDLAKYDTMDEYNEKEPVVMAEFKRDFPHLAQYAHYETAEESLFDTVGTIDMILSEFKSMLLDNEIRLVETVVIH